MIGEGETTHCLGDVLAGVVAETEAHGTQAAARLIKIDYEVLEPVTDMHRGSQAWTALKSTPAAQMCWRHAASDSGDVEKAFSRGCLGDLRYL
ncbi:MAG: hypothetical protein MZV63_49135 [Marinilabiliales bacterium]|nr:hypothetical protein [Marinilabiliales bacterium]